jgi:hypothetical protein
MPMSRPAARTSAARGVLQLSTPSSIRRSPALAPGASATSNASAGATVTVSDMIDACGAGAGITASSRSLRMKPDLHDQASDPRVDRRQRPSLANVAMRRHAPGIRTERASELTAEATRPIQRCRGGLSSVGAELGVA